MYSGAGGGAGAWLYNFLNALNVACSSGSQPSAAPVKMANPLTDFLGRMNARERLFVTHLQQLASSEAQLRKDEKIAKVDIAPKQQAAAALSADAKVLVKDDGIGAAILASNVAMKDAKSALLTLEKEYKAGDKTKLLQMNALSRDIAFQSLLLVNKVRMMLLEWRALEDVVSIQAAADTADVLLYKKITADDQLLELLLAESEQEIVRCEQRFNPVAAQSKAASANDAKNSATTAEVSPLPSFNPMTWLVAELNRQVKCMDEMREELRKAGNALDEKGSAAPLVDAASFLQAHKATASAASAKPQKYNADAMQTLISSCQVQLNALRDQLAKQYASTDNSSVRKAAFDEICKLSASLTVRYKSLLLDMQITLTEWRMSKDVMTQLLLGLSPDKLKADFQEFVDRKLFEKYAVDIQYLHDVFNTVNRDVTKCITDVQQYIAQDLRDEASLELEARDEVGAVELTRFRVIGSPK